MNGLLDVRITRVDEAAHEVHGVVAEERTDKTGKLKFDYATSKPHFESWIAERMEASHGASQGNVREMHQPLAAGFVQSWTFDDASKEIACVAKVIDPLAWLKVTSGTYTGFSIGGDYAGPMWKDADEPGVLRFTAKPYEVSLVDNPQMWGTNFDFYNARGAVEQRQFHAEGGAMRGGDLVRSLVATAQQHLARLRGTGVADDAKCIRGMWSVSDLAAIIRSLDYLCADAKWEAESEGDGSTIPAQLAAELAALGNILVAMTAEEVAELTAKHVSSDLGAGIDGVAMALGTIAGVPTLQRATLADKKLQRRLQKMHDTAVECGAACDGAKLSMARGTTVAPDPKEDTMTEDQIQAMIQGALVGQEAKPGALQRALGDLLSAESFTRALGETIKGQLEAVVKPELERAMTALGELKAGHEETRAATAALAARLDVVEKQPVVGQVPLTRALGDAAPPTSAPMVGAQVANPSAARALILEARKRPQPLSAFEAA